MAGNTVYVQGSYVDVHDNEVVNLSIEKAMVSVDANGEPTGTVEDSVGQHTSGNPRNEELFHFVHPELDEEEAWKIHDAVKRYVATNKVIDICSYLKQLKDRGKIMLPQSPSDAYHELVRMGMPNGEGFGEKHFSGKYKK